MFIDRHIHSQGGRRISWFAALSIWDDISNAFPISCVLSDPAALKQDKPYLFCVHPHGILSWGALGTFVRQQSGIRAFLPNIDLRVCGITLVFFIPFFRELCLYIGMVSASKQSLAHLAKKRMSAMLVIGGAEETLLANPGRADLILLKRKGFVRAALENGSFLVPCYSFGENDLYYQVSFMTSFQRLIQKLITFAVPVCWGSFGIIPLFRPVTTVIGQPIPHPARKGSLNDQVDTYHASYVKALERLYKDNVAQYGSQLEKSGPGLRLVK